MYQRRTPKPKVWRPGLPLRVALGLLPGLRVIALVGVRQGAVYAILGVLSILGTIYLTARWNGTLGGLERILVDERWILVHAGMIVSLIGGFELSRFGATLEEVMKGPRTPRFMAALLLPALVVVIGAPQVMAVWPRFVEATWLAALTVVIGTAPPALWCAAGGLDRPLGKRRPWLLGVAFAALVAALLSVSLLIPASRRFLGETAARLGFELLPALLNGSLISTG